MNSKSERIAVIDVFLSLGWRTVQNNIHLLTFSASKANVTDSNFGS